MAAMTDSTAPLPEGFTVGLLECGRNRADWVERYGGFADWFDPLLRGAAPQLQFRRYRADQGELPPDAAACDAWLLTGSPASVYEDQPWQLALTGFVRSAAAAGQPLVGICYGHQHLHAALGGTVAKAPEWGVGIQRYAVDAAPAWLDADGADSLRLIALHQDQVIAPAPGTRTLAHSDMCRFGLTMIGDRVLTFQAHPEMSPEQAAEIYRYRAPDIGEDGAELAIRSLGGARDDGLAARWIVRFLAQTRAPQQEDER